MTKKTNLFDFNSIKVRLEPLLFIMVDDDVILFQFHKGAIRTSHNTS